MAEHTFAELADAIADYSDAKDEEIMTTVSSLTERVEELTETVSDNEPYIFRQGKGNLVDMDLVGGTVAWNQLAGTASTTEDNGITYTVSNGVVTLDGTATADSQLDFNRIDYIANHKYLVCGVPSGASYNGYRLKAITGQVIKNGIYYVATNDYWTTAIMVKSGTTVSNVKFTPQIYDLTQMFGTTIADAIYAMEEANAGAGVAFFRKYFPKSYYAYNAGQLLSVKPSGRKVVGKNLYNKNAVTRGYWINNTGTALLGSNSAYSDYIPITCGVNYYFSHIVGLGAFYSIAIYDFNKNFIETISIQGMYDSSGTVVFTKGAYIRVNIRDVYIDTVQVEIGNTATDYEPYDSSEYLFPSIDLRGIPKLVDNKLSYDGDIYNADGNITRKYGIVDLGTLTWSKGQTTAGHYRFTAPNSNVGKSHANNVKPNAICSKYEISTSDDLWNQTAEGITVNGTGDTFIAYIASYESGDAATFKTAMSGVYLVYELATPTTESAPIYVNPQRAFTDGTEEWLDDRDVAIPVGHNSTYYLNETYSPVTKYADSVNEQRVSWEDNGVLGAKNLLLYDLDIIKTLASNATWSGNVCTKNGGTFTFNDDGSCVVNGTFTTNTEIQWFIRLGDKRYRLDDGIYKLVCYSVGGAINFALGCTRDNAFYNLASGSKSVAKLFELLPTDGDMGFSIVVPAGTYNNVSVYTMILMPDDADYTQRPYAMTNRELTDAKADKSDLTSINVPGSTNTTGATISSGKYFYLNGVLCKAKSDIASNATLTKNTNYEEVTAGGLNDFAEVGPWLGYGNVRTITSQTPMSDLDNGIYSMPSSDSSIFDGFSKLIMIFKYGTDSGLQIAYKVRNNADVSANLAFRYCYDGTYFNWSIISATNQT